MPRNGTERQGGMFYIIIGQSGSGKTSFVKKRFLTEPLEVYEDIVYCTRSGKTVALGKYGIGIRTEGTDTLAYNAKDKIKKQLKKLKAQGVDVVLEGDRINNAEILNYISAIGAEAKIYLVTCSLKTSMERLRAAGSTISPTFVKTTKTKSRNTFLQFASRYNGEVIKTD